MFINHKQNNFRMQMPTCYNGKYWLVYVRLYLFATFVFRIMGIHFNFVRDDILFLVNAL